MGCLSTSADYVMNDTPGTMNAQHLRRRLEIAAGTFDRADFVCANARDGLMQRIAPIIVDADYVLDLGAALGAGSRLLARRFRRSRIISIDISAGMLNRCKAARPWFTRRSELQADALQLPFRAGTIDVVFANLLLPWIDDLPACLGEVARVLRKDGLIAFSTLGPDSFAQVRDAWRKVDDTPHVRQFADMHDVGDALIHAGLRDPVLDVEHVHVNYADPETLFRDLSNAGARNSLAGRRRTLTGKARLAEFRRILFEDRAGEPLCVTIELVFGHAWGGGAVAPGEYRVDPGAIPRRSRSAESLS